jgi:hypothetical protein
MVFWGRSLQAPAPAQPPSPTGEAPAAPNQELGALAATPPAGAKNAWVRFDAPTGTVIQHGDQRFAAGLSFPIPPGPFTIEYRCPGRSAPITTVVNVLEGRSDTQVVPIKCGTGR